jgi:hypothetical protein
MYKDEEDEGCKAAYWSVQIEVQLGLEMDGREDEAKGHAMLSTHTESLHRNDDGDQMSMLGV